MLEGKECLYIGLIYDCFDDVKLHIFKCPCLDAGKVWIFVILLRAVFLKHPPFMLISLFHKYIDCSYGLCGLALNRLITLSEFV